MPVLLPAVITVLFSCNNSQADGGGCSYNTQKIPATLIKLVDVNSQSYDAIFEVTINGHKDTLSYARKNNAHYIFIDNIPKDSLVPGKQYQYVLQKIMSGKCTPEVDFIILKSFTVPQSTAK